MYEGSEKKVEIVTDLSAQSFRSLTAEEWDRLLSGVPAYIVSKMSNQSCDAYILSGSSLFVYDHKILMLTCGETTPVSVIARVIELVPPEKIIMLLYDRRNELFPEKQLTNFYEDASALWKLFPGTVTQIGDPDENHIHIFYYKDSQKVCQKEISFEMFMHEINENISSIFCMDDHSIFRLLGQTGLREIISGFNTNEHIFDPPGYSLNAISSDYYFTIHVTVTPHRVGSYASFRTNFNVGGNLRGLIGRLLRLFTPLSFSLVFLNNPKGSIFFNGNYENYMLTSSIEQKVGSGCKVHFTSFIASQNDFKRKGGITAATDGY